MIFFIEQEEVDEARKLAEEWELKYKEMQRQMADLDMARRTNMDKKVHKPKHVVSLLILIMIVSKAVDGLNLGLATNAVHVVDGLRRPAALAPM